MTKRARSSRLGRSWSSARSSGATGVKTGGGRGMPRGRRDVAAPAWVPGMGGRFTAFGSGGSFPEPGMGGRSAGTTEGRRGGMKNGAAGELMAPLIACPPYFAWARSRSIRLSTETPSASAR